MSNRTAIPENKEREDAIYNFIIAFKTEHDASPTLREIAQACDIPSTSVVDYYIKKMARNGRIKNTPRGRATKSRMITVPGYSWRRDSEARE